MTVCSMARSKVKFKFTSFQKSENRPFSKAISSPIYTLENDHGFLYYGAMASAYRGRIWEFCPTFVSRDFEVRSK